LGTAPWLLAQLAKLDKDLGCRVNQKNIALISGAQSGAMEVLVGLATQFVFHAWFPQRFYFLV
jgi:hypothetical protein